jgi:tyrosine-specific transport protein
MTIQTQTSPSIFGGILLVIGNVIGAGILALPIAIAQIGFAYAILVLLCIWLIMMLGAYYFLEANLAMPQGSNFISMSRAALGRLGVVLTWACNLLVMYCLISAFIAGGGDVVAVNFQYLGIKLPAWVSPTIFLVIFGFIVSRGIHITDHANRFLMITKALVFIAVIMGLLFHFNADIIQYTPQQNLSAGLIVIVITSYGFANLIPSLRVYYQSDVQKLRKIVFWGMFIPFLCYCIWVILVFSTIPYSGKFGLQQMAQSANPVADLQHALNQALHIQWITQAINIFSAITIVTSFLASSIALTDFVADGCNISKNQKHAWIIYLIAYLPALCAVIFYPRAFLAGLSIAGAIGIVQLLIIPIFIVYAFRYSRQQRNLSYSVFGGKSLLLIFLVISCALLLITVLK